MKMADIAAGPGRIGARRLRGPALALWVGVLGLPAAAGPDGGPVARLNDDSTGTRPVRQRPPAPPRSQPQAVRPTGRISLAFTNTEVRDVLAQIAAYSGTDIILTPGARGQVSVSVRNRTPEEAIGLVAAAAGLSVARIGGVYVVGPAAEVQAATAQAGRSEVLPVQNITPQDAANLLALAVPRVKVEAARNAVVVSGLSQDIAAARAALERLDVPAAVAPPKIETQVVPLKTIEPAEAERILRQAAPSLRISRQDRTLILSGPTADLDVANKALQAIDVEAPKPPERQAAFVYRLKYLHAGKAEESLKKVFPAESGLAIAIAPEATAPPQAMFNPLAGGFGGGLGGAGGAGGGLSGGLGGGLGGAGGGLGGGLGGAGGGLGGAVGGATQQELNRATRLILIGPQDQIDMARQLLEEVDVPQPTVRIEAALVELSRDAFKQLGVRWDFTQPGELTGDSGRTSTGVQATVPGGPGIRFGTLSVGGFSFRSFLDALIIQNKGRILASPNISVVDLEDANIFIGDLIRFRGTTVVTQTSTVQATDAIPIGIALLVRPRIHPDDSVTLKVHPVISTLKSFDQGLPQTATREADTTVRLKKGEELVIGGLDRKELRETLRKVPILGDLPVLGELFRSRSRDSVDTEVVVIIRAYAVQAEPAPAKDFGQGGDGK